MRDLSQYKWTSFGTASMEDVEADIRQGGVRDERIIAAALQFRPGDFRPWDFLPRPAIVAGIAEALQPSPESKVLDIGTGTGYLAAVLAALARQVISIEIHPTLAAMARQTLEKVPYSSKITIVDGDGSGGYAQEAPYDCIAVHGSLRQVPPELNEQLAADGGRMLVGVGTPNEQELQLITRRGSDLSAKVLGHIRFAALRGKYGEQASE